MCRPVTGELNSNLRASTHADENTAVKYPGDEERRFTKHCDHITFSAVFLKKKKKKKKNELLFPNINYNYFTKSFIISIYKLYN